MKPRDIIGNDLIVPATALAMIMAAAEGKSQDLEYVKKLSFQFYDNELRRLKCD